MNKRVGGRCSASLLVLLLLAAMIGCGGNGNSANNSNNTGTNGSGNPGTANPGGNGGPTGPPTPGTTYLYAGAYVDQGAIYGFQVNTSAGTLAQVAGSPWILPNGTSTGGAVAVKNGFVYSANQPSSTSGGAILTYKIDQATGALAQQGSAVVVTPTADGGIRRLIASRFRDAIYAVTQSTVYLISVSGGTPSLVTQQTAGDVVWGLAETANAVFVGVQNGNPKQGFQFPVIEGMASTGSLGAPSEVATLSDANIPFDLTADTAGKFLAVTTGLNSTAVSMFSIGSGGTLTPVSGSPFATNSLTAQVLRFDPTGQFLYVLTNEEPVPNRESMVVFSVGNGGTLTSVQAFDLTSDVRAAWMVVTNNFVYVINDAVSGAQGTIIVLRRSQANGQLSNVGTTTLAKPLAEADLASL